MTVAVGLNLPDDVYLALAATAMRQNTQVHRLIEVGVTKSVRRRPKDAPTTRVPKDDIDRRIVELNKEGLGDNAISKVVGIHQTTVSKRRRDMGLQSPTPKAGPR